MRWPRRAQGVTHGAGQVEFGSTTPMRTCWHPFVCSRHSCQYAQNTCPNNQFAIRSTAKKAKASFHGATGSPHCMLPALTPGEPWLAGMVLGSSKGHRAPAHPTHVAFPLLQSFQHLASTSELLSRRLLLAPERLSASCKPQRTWKAKWTHRKHQNRAAETRGLLCCQCFGRRQPSAKK
jgi:hypothetical protein